MLEHGSLRVDTSSLIGCTATDRGGCISAAGSSVVPRSLFIEGCDVHTCLASTGGGLAATSTMVRIERSLLQQTKATDRGESFAVRTAPELASSP